MSDDTTHTPGEDRPDELDDLDLAALSDEELVLQMHDDLYDGLKDEIAEGTTILLARGWPAERVLNESLVEAMRIVGNDFRDGILFVPEVLLAANAMKAGMEILRPLLAETGAESIGTVVIGTVKGDIHDIGKNLVAMMLEGAGFDVVDLGINTDVDEFLAAIDEHQPDIIGMSALLTTTMPYMKVVIDTLIERGRREELIVLVGGAPLNEEFGVAVGADAYCRDAAVAAETAKKLITERRSTTESSGLSAPAHEMDTDRADTTLATPTFGVDGPARLFVIACGALAHELKAVLAANGLRDIIVECLPARLHNHPKEIPEAVQHRIRRAREQGHEQIFVGYADCGTGGMLAAVCEEEGVEMLDGAHCYEFFATTSRFAQLQEAEIGSFYLTDFLVKHFDRMIWSGLELDRYPELLSSYFGNYTRCVYLAQTDDEGLLTRARAAAARLEMDLMVEPTGYGDLETTMVRIGRPSEAAGGDV